MNIQKMKIRSFFVLALLVAFVIMSGCVGNQSKVNTNTIVNQGQINTEKYVLNTSKTNSTTETTETQSKTENVNQTMSSNQLNCELNKVYFIYADWCPHCQKMKPWVTQLEEEGYQFVRIDSQNPDLLNIAKQCLTGIAQLKYIPEFACLANKQTHTGEFASIDEMKTFASACNGRQ